MLCTKYHSAILQKGLNWKFCFLSWRKINGYVLQIYKANFSNTIWFRISEKVHYEVHLSSPVMVHAICRRSQQTRYTKIIVCQNSQFFRPTCVPSCVVVIFVDMNSYIPTEGRNLKTFWKQNYAITLDSCNLFTKKCWTCNLTGFW